jgi:hypothetical protein
MFKLFKSKKTIETLIAEIHNEFDSASEKLLNEAKELLKDKSTTSKGDRLKNLGFTKAKPVIESEELRKKESQAKYLAERVSYFNQWYPHNKFITEEAVKTICEKYGLVFGDIAYYKGDVPEKNILEMELFNLRNEDMDSRSYISYFESDLDRQIRIMNGIADGIGILGSLEWANSLSTKRDDSIKKHYFKQPFKICAPEKDFDTRFLVKKGYKLEHDPIVLQPVKGGYLIVTKWGLEANDESLVNPKTN